MTQKRGHGPQAATFDAVLIAYLHLPPDELARVWALAATAVAPGGTLLIVGHDRTNLTDGVGGPQDERVLYDAQTIAASLAGLRVLRTERVRRPVGDREALDTLVRAERAAVTA